MGYYNNKGWSNMDFCNNYVLIYSDISIVGAKTVNYFYFSLWESGVQEKSISWIRRNGLLEVRL